MKAIRLLLTLAAILALSSCEKFNAEGTLADGNGENGNVTITVSNHIISTFEQEGATTRSEDGTSTETPTIKDICTRISFAFFKDDEKVKTINQAAEKDNFGTASINLSEGTYRLVVIAHNGAGNCTISSPEEVKFNNNKMTDTFIYYGTLDVAEDEETDQEINLSRAVAKIRIHIKDDIPTTAKQLKFYYTGGSSTLDATTGQGCVNSRQTEYIDIVAGQQDYEVYTFPHKDGKKVKLTLTVLDQENAEITAKTISDIPVTQNHITTYSGYLFDSSGSGSSSSGKEGTTTGITLKFTPEWAGEEAHEF